MVQRISIHYVCKLCEKKVMLILEEKEIQDYDNNKVLGVKCPYCKQKIKFCKEEVSNEINNEKFWKILAGIAIIFSIFWMLTLNINYLAITIILSLFATYKYHKKNKKSK